jgi:hypothetical protein
MIIKRNRTTETILHEMMKPLKKVAMSRDKSAESGSA